MSSKAPSTSKDTSPAVPPIMARIAHVMANLGIAGLPRNYELLFEALNGNASVAREIAALPMTVMISRHACLPGRSVSTIRSACSDPSVISY